MIGSVRTAIRILNCFNSKVSELGITDISDLLNMNKSTVHHLVHTMCSNGVLARTTSRKYRLGLKLLEWGHLVAEHQEILTIAKPYLKIIVENTGETAHLAQYHQGEVVYLEKQESPKSVAISTKIGSRKMAYCTALGKAILAHRSTTCLEEVVKNGLISRTSNTITDPNQFTEEIRSIKMRGFAVDNEEYEEGLFCVAAPIREYTGDVNCAISVSGPAFRLKRKGMESTSRLIIKVASKISQEMGYFSSA